ncbi:MAG: hypothetical protein K6G15_00960 [Desulfovibrio sp.]|nr:hypothetical protein [Desulfovibrio sp.]
MAQTACSRFLLPALSPNLSRKLAVNGLGLSKTHQNNHKKVINMRLLRKNFKEDDLFACLFSACVISASKDEQEPEIEDVVRLLIKTVTLYVNTPRKERQKIIDLKKGLANIPAPKLSKSSEQDPTPPTPNATASV